ncbi:sigma-70 family RNA polymerase sigma factor [Prevotella amnii]|uniref:sigma-70 family RNA polymerase sigma factor n=1 Tax=Prevotella amnii TaxID=419005 RepID=UPI0003739874|nr:sigma-70 family RNA polymerase sigma factor [Prevotella amnii]
MAVNEKYIGDIIGENLLSDEEEVQLSNRIKIGDAKALEKLTKANLTFVVSIAHQYKEQGLDEDDLISEGNIGMMYAAQKFDGSKGIRFVKFAAPYIRKAIEKSIKEQTTLYKVPKKENKLFEKKRAKPVSLDQPIPVGSNNKLTLQNLIPNNNNKDTDDSVNNNILNTILMQSINCLNEREKAVITQLYGINGTSLTMAEIATSLGLKRERVRQIRNTALRKLYRKMR